MPRDLSTQNLVFKNERHQSCVTNHRRRRFMFILPLLKYIGYGSLIHAMTNFATLNFKIQAILTVKPRVASCPHLRPQKCGHHILYTNQTTNYRHECRSTGSNDHYYQWRGKFAIKDEDRRSRNLCAINTRARIFHTPRYDDITNGMTVHICYPAQHIWRRAWRPLYLYGYAPSKNKWQSLI